MIKKPGYFLVFILLCLPFLFVSGQEPIPVQKTTNKVLIEGKVYLLHVVRAGQTLYSISRAYNVDMDLIEKENPWALSGLRPGQVLKIPDITSEPVAPALSEPLPQHILTDTVDFIEHVLQQGETLFSLGRKYTISLEEIERANPGIDPAALKIGQIVFIPRLIEVEPPDEEIVEYIRHRVRRRETIYGISRQYGITQEELKQHNPELYESELRMWQILNIPVKPSPDILAEVEVIPDTLEIEAIADTLKKDFYEIYEDIDIHMPGRAIKIAYLIPFNFREEVPDTLNADTIASPSAGEGQAEDGSPQLTKPGSIPFLEFLEGSFIALDSIKKTGAELYVNVFDTRASPSRLRSVISSGKLDDMDLIIGPFHSYNLEVISAFSLKNRIPVISPFHDSDSLLASNPYLFQMRPSASVELNAIAEFTRRNPGYHIVVLSNRNNPAEVNRARYLRQRIIESLSIYQPFAHTLVKEVIFDPAVNADLPGQLREVFSADSKNLLIVPSISEAFVTQTVMQTYFLLQNYDIEIFGMPHWSVFSNVELLYLHRLQFKYLTPYNYSFQDQNVIDFLSKWRRLFASEPSEHTGRGCNYAFLGHDLTWYFVNSFLRYGPGFMVHNMNLESDLLMNSFKFRKHSYNGGFENIALEFVKYHPDLSITSENFEYIPGIQIVNDQIPAEAASTP